MEIRDATLTEDQDDFKIKGKGKQPIYPTTTHHAVNTTVTENAPAKPTPPQDTCVICLEPISERAVAVPCNHVNYDFLCLVSWLQEQRSCPLCKTPITEVQYDFRSPTEYKSYTPEDPPTTRPHAQVRHHPRPRPRPRPRTRPPSRGHRPYTPAHASDPSLALAFRRSIYAQHRYSCHVGSNRVSAYRSFTAQTFAADAHLQSRARTFMRRELSCFPFLLSPSSNSSGNSSGSSSSTAGERGDGEGEGVTTSTKHIAFLIEYLVAVLQVHEIKHSSGAAQQLLAEFLGGEHAALFLHELEQWLRSPYETLADWDRHVQYAAAVGTPGRASSSSSSSSSRRGRAAVVERGGGVRT